MVPMEVCESLMREYRAFSDWDPARRRNIVRELLFACVELGVVLSGPSSRSFGLVFVVLDSY